MSRPSGQLLETRFRLMFESLLGLRNRRSESGRGVAGPLTEPALVDHLLIIQTIRRDTSGSVQIDDPSNLTRPDRSGADQIDAQHQATDLAVGAAPASHSRRRRRVSLPCFAR